MRKLILAAVIAGLTVLWSGSAQAISVENRERLEKHFADLGTIHYELYAPLGGTEVGGVILDDGDGSGTLHIARVDNKKVTDLITESVPDLEGRPPFTFLLTGFHVLTYITRDWTDEAGRPHRRGDLKVYDIEPEGEDEVVPRLLYELKDVCDLSFHPGGGMNNDNLVWQPSQHFLNDSRVLPVKNEYVQFSYDPEADEYYFLQHLTALDDAAEVDSANFNNRAILAYRDHRLLDASLYLKRANDIAQADQSIILRNQALINSEIADLEDQAERIPDRPADLVLQYYWQGDYSGVLRIMEARSGSGYTDYDAAVIGISLAQEGRWPESDSVTEELSKRNPGFLADYHWELCQIANRQGYPEIAGRHLLTIEQLDRYHPGYVLGLYRLLNQSGEPEKARRLLENYVLQPQPGRDLHEPRYELFQLYYREADQIGQDRLVRDSLSAPVLDLLGYVELIDYHDLSLALTEIPLDTSGRLVAPKHPLEVFDVN